MPQKTLNKKINSGKCIISSCLRSYRNSSKEFPVRLFSFPSNDLYYNKWAKNCHLDGNVNRKSTFICDRHFKSKYLGKKRLKGDAVPTLHLGKAPVKVSSAVCEQSDSVIEYEYIEITRVPEMVIESSYLAKEPGQTRDDDKYILLEPEEPCDVIEYTVCLEDGSIVS